jgi:hypothetical protein
MFERNEQSSLSQSREQSARAAAQWLSADELLNQGLEGSFPASDTPSAIMRSAREDAKPQVRLTP